mmetsp:Transcript_7741/g.32282  ORF Transcript_7741/g.32282 Transcript_7741/m.32282 type:complete len:279 (-) Transcript_7741:265-1101(-)
MTVDFNQRKSAKKNSKRMSQKTEDGRRIRGGKTVPRKQRGMCASDPPLPPKLREEDEARAAAERNRGVGATKAQASRFGARRAGGVDSRAARDAERDAGFRAWEYGETGFEGQFDDEGRLRSADESRSNESRSNDDRAMDSRDARRRNRDGDGASSSDSDSTSSFSDSSDSDSDDADLIPSQRRSVGSNGSWRDRAGGARKKKKNGAPSPSWAPRACTTNSRAPASAWTTGRCTRCAKLWCRGFCPRRGARTSTWTCCWSTRTARRGWRPTTRTSCGS